MIIQKILHEKLAQGIAIFKNDGPKQHNALEFYFFLRIFTNDSLFPSNYNRYHSHLAIQRNDGIFGMIIVHPSAKEVKETIPLFISDWGKMSRTFSL